MILNMKNANATYKIEGIAQGINMISIASPQELSREKSQGHAENRFVTESYAVN
jgi:hypothetical protein